METLNQLFGVGKDISSGQMCCRAFVFFFITLLYLRIAGVRTFGKKCSIDTIVVIILGSVIARGIAGASGFGATAGAALVLVVTHRLVAWLTLKSQSIETLVKGRKKLLYSNGSFIRENMSASCITMSDFLESMRSTVQQDNLTNIVSAHMETNGEISFIVKHKQV